MKLTLIVEPNEDKSKECMARIQQLVSENRMLALEPKTEKMLNSTPHNQLTITGKYEIIVLY